MPSVRWHVPCFRGGMSILPSGSEHSSYVDFHEGFAGDEADLVSPCAHSVREPEMASEPVGSAHTFADRARACWSVTRASIVIS